MDILGIVIALALLVALAWRGLPILLLAPACALLVALMGGQPLLASLTQVYMPALAQFVALYFLLFLLGALFGKLMQASGAADALAQAIVQRLGAGHAVAAVVLACAVLTYGGVSLFVVAFAVWPLAAALFQAARVPLRLAPAAIALGAFTFTMTALPGTPAIQNAIPMPYFGTTPFAAPGLGLIGGVVMLGVGVAWLSWRLAQAHARGEGAGHSDTAPESVAHAAAPPPSLWLALAPIGAVLLINALLAEVVLPRWGADYLAEPRWGATRLDAVRGLWALVAALAAANLLLAALGWRRMQAAGRPLAQVLEVGGQAALLPLLNTASLVGFGAVVAQSDGFAQMRDAVLGIAPGNPLVSLSVAVNLLAGLTGSASGGMSIALQTLGADYLQRAADAGIAPELLHRVTAIATGGLDALPHNGAVVTLLGICGMSHRQSYADIFVVAVLGPLLALAVVVALGTVLGSF